MLEDSIFRRLIDTCLVVVELIIVAVRSGRWL
jgi:hypothetical protein